MADLLEDRTLQNQAYEGDLDAVKAAVESAESAKAVATRKDSDGRTLLHWAASGGRMDVVDYLMTIEGVKVNSRDESQWTPLMSGETDGLHGVYVMQAPVPPCARWTLQQLGGC